MEWPDVLTTDEAARYLRVSVWTVYRLIANGKLEPLDVGSGTVPRHRIPIEQLEQLKESGNVRKLSARSA